MVRQTLTSQITAFDRPSFFQDCQRRGPFAFMRHDHHFRSLPDGSTEMRDVFCCGTPALLGGMMTDALILRRYMRRLLRERNAVVRDIAESANWAQYLVS